MASALMWGELAQRALKKLDKADYLRHFPLISYPPPAAPAEDCLAGPETFAAPGPWDRTNVELELENYTNGVSSRKKALIFSSNYLGLSSHPAVRKAIAKTSLSYGTGVRASSMICGHSNYHRQLEATLAGLTKKEECVITPTGFAANNSFLAALGSIATLLAADGRRPSKAEKIAIFSDQLNHASIIGGLRHVERLREADVFVYKHNDMGHLDYLLSKCPAERKVVFADSYRYLPIDYELQSVQHGRRFAPMLQLIELRKKHGFLLVIDDAHTTLVCGKNGGGIAETYGIEDEIDICIGTLSKATGCIGGFIACSKKWKPLIQARGRSYIFTTSLPVPIVIGILAAIEVSKKEDWRRKLVWSHVEYFASKTKFHVTSPIVSLVVGTEEAALRASRQLLESGFHVTAIRPPAVAPDACRLRVTLTACHTREDVDNLITALPKCIRIPSHIEEEDQYYLISKLDYTV